jgi:serine/threonine protein kinase/tetratricopeptide (TPR) repeat protein
VSAASLTGQSILHYHIRERLGAGGSGEVYVADDTRLGRQVALKFLNADRQRDADSRARLLREARAASSLRSPNIAVTYEFVEHGDMLFIAMEYVEGELLSDRIRRGPVPAGEAVDIAAQVADALDEAHGQNIVHRDIKSANLIQTKRGLVKVLDFGLAKMDVPRSTEKVLRSTSELLVTSPGMVLGTIAYMAPEQLRADSVDHRVDLFALGVVLYELLTARLPFRGATLADTFDRIFYADPEPVSRSIPGVLPELERILWKALQKSADHRYQSARELHIDLRQVARRLEVNESTQGLRAPRVETGQRSIAVLTFTNVTRDASDDWIGTGIAETVTADLKNVQNLAVIGRGQISELLNAMRPSERASDHLPIEIGRRLGAWWVVSGAYQRQGERIRVTVQLIEVLTGKLIRTVKVDGRIDEIFELQDRIVFDVSRGLDLKLQKEDADAIERDETHSVEAFEAYSRGVLNLRSAGREAMDRAIGLFERAVTLDPTYATAWSALGGVYYLKGQFLGVRDLHHKALEYLRRAIELKPTLANAHVWLGSAYLQLGEIDRGIGALKTAQRLEPDNADVHQTLARAFWLFRGMVPEGIAELRQAIALNPEGGYSYLQLSMLEALSGHLDEAETSARHAIELQERAMSGTEGLLILGAHSRLGYVYYLRGKYDLAYVEYRRELEYVTTSDHALRERTLIELHQKFSALHRARGDHEAAMRFGDMAIETHTRRVAIGADDPATRYYMAALHAGRGDVEHTLEHLALPLARLPEFTRWRLARDRDFDPVRATLNLNLGIS